MISKNIEKNKREIRRIFNDSSDIALYEFETLCKQKALVGYIEVLVDKKVLYEDLIKPLVQNLENTGNVLSTVFIVDGKEVYDMEKISRAMTNGSVVLFIEDVEVGYLFGLRCWEKRGIEESGNERVIRGPKEGFIEDININKSLIRRKIRNTNLVFEDYILGTQTNTPVSLSYIDGIVNQKVLDELRSRIQKIDIDGILDTGYIEHYIEDSPKSVVCTIGHTEKPDVVAAKILEGRIAILCDGTSNVLTVPKVFIENLQMSEDYYIRPQYATYLRIMRIFSLFTSILLPGFVVALETFHHEMIPTSLLISIAQSRENVPFTALVEALLMVIFFELIKESGLRIPTNVGSAVTVISGLVLGQTAVEAGLVGPIMVITVATTGISEFIIPEQREMIAIYRIVILFLGGVLGLFGIASGMTIMIAHLISLKSFGVPYMYPIAPYDKEGMRDFIIKHSIKNMNYRPRNIANKKQRKRNERHE